MEIQKVFIYPHPILFKKCQEFPRDKDPKNLVEKLRATLDNIPTGVGLAAPQIGYSYRVFLGPQNKAFINPEIQLKGDSKTGGEGCLSIPGINVFVDRYQKVKVKWFDENWQEHTEVFRKFDAVLIQHEFDQIEGMTFLIAFLKSSSTNILRYSFQ